MDTSGLCQADSLRFCVQKDYGPMTSNRAQGRGMYKRMKNFTCAKLAVADNKTHSSSLRPTLTSKLDSA